MPRGRAPPKPPPPASRGSDGDSESSGGELDGTSDALAWIAKPRPMSARERRALGPELAARAAAAKAAASAQETAAARAGAQAGAQVKPEGARELERRVTFDLEGAEPLCGDFASDGKIVALACRDGVARAFNASSGKAVSTFRSERASFGTAACALAFHKGRNVAAVGNTAGEIWYWHVTARRPLMPTPLTQEGSAPAAVTFSPDASYFASASTEGALRLYDANLFVQTALLDGGADSNNCGHSNRAFAVGFVGESATVCVTAGWDGRAVLWDARAGGAVASAHGSHVCGQALDASRGETEVILGSWREADALQVWDLRAGHATRTIASGGRRLYSLDASAVRKDGVVATGGEDVRLVHYKSGTVLAWGGTTDGEAVHSVRVRPGAIATDEIFVCTAKEAYTAPVGGVVAAAELES